MNGSYFAGRLKELREAKGLSQAALAEKSGLTGRQVSRMETGVQSPSWETVLALCAVLDVSTEAFRAEPASAPAPKRGRPGKAPPAIKKPSRRKKKA